MSGSVSHAEALTWARTALAATCETARLDAEVLLVQVLGWSRARLLAHPGASLDPALARRFEALVERRRGGEPIAYLTGRREFWSLDLVVTPDTLIPRPETEHLVEAVLGVVSPGDAATIADIGTGTGAVALALGHERPRAFVIGSDRSRAAVAVARANAARLGTGNVSFIVADACRRTGADPLVRHRVEPPLCRGERSTPHDRRRTVRTAGSPRLRAAGADHVGDARVPGPSPVGARGLARAGAWPRSGIGSARAPLRGRARGDRDGPRSRGKRAGDPWTARHGRAMIAVEPGRYSESSTPHEYMTLGRHATADDDRNRARA